MKIPEINPGIYSQLILNKAPKTYIGKRTMVLGECGDARV
jgi:hypothetical protein